MGGEGSNDQAALSLAQLARDEFFRGDWSGAEKHIRQSIDLDSEFAPAYDLLSSLLEQAGRFEESAAVARDGLKVEPACGSLYFHLARSRRVEDRSLVSEIDEVLRSGQPAPHDSRYLRYALGKALDDLGEYRLAMENWDLANTISHRLQFQSRPFDRDRYRSYFDRVRKLYAADCLRRNLGIGSDSALPILIVGMPRSGTTLVEQILSNHPEVSAGGEVPYWISNDGAHSEAAKTYPTLPKSFAEKVQSEYLGALTQRASGSPRVTDKMPDNYMVLGRIHCLFPKAPIVHVRRNPADNCLSIYSTPYSRPPRYAYSKNGIAFAYECYGRLMDHWREVLPEGAILDVDYEDLVSNTEASVRSLLEFCGLTWSESCLTPETNRRVVQTPSAWQVRQPINDRSIMKWKRYEPWLGAIASLANREAP